jgi:hypothetical protein
VSTGAPSSRAAEPEARPADAQIHGDETGRLRRERSEACRHPFHDGLDLRVSSSDARADDRGARTGARRANSPPRPWSRAARHGGGRGSSAAAPGARRARPATSAEAPGALLARICERRRRAAAAAPRRAERAPLLRYRLPHGRARDRLARRLRRSPDGAAARQWRRPRRLRDGRAAVTLGDRTITLSDAPDGRPGRGRSRDVRGARGLAAAKAPLREIGTTTSGLPRFSGQ